jgi:hypothetical protein
MEKVTIRKASQGGTMKLKEALKKKQFVVTSEIQAAIEQEPEDLLQSLSKVRGRVDGV